MPHLARLAAPRLLRALRVLRVKRFPCIPRPAAPRLLRALRVLRVKRLSLYSEEDPIDEHPHHGSYGKSS
jgi:hypothetical protein